MGFFLLGMNLGMVLALIFHNAILYMIKTDPPEMGLMMEILIVGLLAGMLSCCLWRKIVILSTSFLGSYILVRGVSLLFGGYP